MTGLKFKYPVSTMPRINKALCESEVVYQSKYSVIVESGLDANKSGQNTLKQKITNGTYRQNPSMVLALVNADHLKNETVKKHSCAQPRQLMSNF